MGFVWLLAVHRLHLDSLIFKNIVIPPSHGNYFSNLHVSFRADWLFVGDCCVRSSVRRGCGSGCGCCCGSGGVLDWVVLTVRCRWRRRRRRTLGGCVRSGEVLGGVVGHVLRGVSGIVVVVVHQVDLVLLDVPVRHSLHHLLLVLARLHPRRRVSNAEDGLQLDGDVRLGGGGGRGGRLVDLLAGEGQDVADGSLVVGDVGGLVVAVGAALVVNAGVYVLFGVWGLLVSSSIRLLKGTGICCILIGMFWRTVQDCKTIGLV